MGIITISKYVECQDCKKTFTLPKPVILFRQKGIYLPIFCPKCESENIAQIDKNQYENANKNKEYL